MIGVIPQFLLKNSHLTTVFYGACLSELKEIRLAAFDYFKVRSFTMNHGQWECDLP